MGVYEYIYVHIHVFTIVCSTISIATKKTHI